MPPLRCADQAGIDRLMETDHRWLGVLLVTASAIAFSTAGFFTRIIALDVWTVLFWRGIFAGLCIACYIAWRHRGQTFVAIRGAGVLACAFSTMATICFINALRRTTVADVAVINATAPFVTASLAALWIAERESWTTLVASLVALLGVVLMFGAAPSAGHVVGNLLAFAMTVLISAMIVIMRSNRDTPMLPAACLSAFSCAIVVAPLAHPGSVSGWDLIQLALFGTTQLGLGLLLLTLGTRLISATRSALIGNLELPLAPLWVWLAFGEVPALMTCAGGGIVTAAVLGHVLLERAKQP